VGNFQKNRIVAKVPNDSINNRNTKIYGILLGIFIVFIAGSIIETKNASSTVSQNESTELIKKYFPDYVLMEIGELTPLARKYFKRHYPNLTPSFVRADFDGDGFLDLALLLRKARGKDRKTILTIFLHSNRNRFELAYYLSFGVYGGDVYIIPVESGKVVSQTESIDVPREKVELRNTAIELVYFEKSSVVYYWDDRMKKFESIWTSD
jgi:hypothetical protein